MNPDVTQIAVLPSSSSHGGSDAPGTSQAAQRRPGSKVVQPFRAGSSERVSLMSQKAQPVENVQRAQPQDAAAEEARQPARPPPATSTSNLKSSGTVTFRRPTRQHFRTHAV